MHGVHARVPGWRVTPSPHLNTHKQLTMPNNTGTTTKQAKQKMELSAVHSRHCISEKDWTSGVKAGELPQQFDFNTMTPCTYSTTNESGNMKY